MEKCTEIKAMVRMEERYEALSLMFGDCPDLKQQVVDAIDTAKKESGLTPFIFEKISNDRPDIQAIYVEFQDGIHRIEGDFFERILELLNIDHCESGLC